MSRRFPETHSVSVGNRPVGAIVFSSGRWIPEVHEGPTRGTHFPSEATQAKARKVVQDSYVRAARYAAEHPYVGGAYRKKGKIFTATSLPNLQLALGYRYAVESGDGEVKYFVTRPEAESFARNGTHEGYRRKKGRELSTPERHQLRIARDNFRNPAKAYFLGGPSPSESREIIKRLTGKDPGPPAEDSRLPGYHRKKGWGNRTDDRAARRRGIR